jgi:hypothetical protein
VPVGAPPVHHLPQAGASCRVGLGVRAALAHEHPDDRFPFGSRMIASELACCTGPIPTQSVTFSTSGLIRAVLAKHLKELHTTRFTR